MYSALKRCSALRRVECAERDCTVKEILYGQTRRARLTVRVYYSEWTRLYIRGGRRSTRRSPVRERLMKQIEHGKSVARSLTDKQMAIGRKLSTLILVVVGSFSFFFLYIYIYLSISSSSYITLSLSLSLPFTFKMSRNIYIYKSVYILFFPLY